MNRHQRGFTLLEVMMALAVLAISGMALLNISRENLSNSHYLSQKRPAYWVAENALTNIRLSKQWPPEQWRTETQPLADRDWQVRSRSIKTGSTNFRMVEVEVRSDKGSKATGSSKTAPLAQLQTHMLRP